MSEAVEYAKGSPGWHREAREAARQREAQARNGVSRYDGSPPADWCGTLKKGAKALDAMEDGTINIHKWPVMKSKANYGVIGRIATLATATSEADPVAIIGTAITWAGAELGRARYTRIGDAYHHSRHFTNIVGLSALARKGTSRDSVERIFKRAEEVRLEKAHSAEASFPSGCALNVTGGPLSSAEGVIYEIRDPSEKKDKDGKVEDAGVEDKRLLVVEEEFASVFRVAERAGNLLSTILRRAYDGGTLRPITKRDRISATRPHLCIVGHITLYELRLMLKKCGNEIWNGFVNRFQWLLVRRSKVLSRPQPMPDEAVDDIAEELADAILWAHAHPGPVVMSDGALTLWDAVFAELTFEDPGIVGAMLSRQATHAYRIALTYSQLDKSEVITEVHLEAAMAVCRYARDSVIYLFGESKSNPVADTIVKALEKAPVKRLSLTEVSALFKRHVGAEALRKALQELQERALVTVSTERRVGPGKPTTYVTLNPGA
jgi:hypothetical protein